MTKSKGAIAAAMGVAVFAIAAAARGAPNDVSPKRGGETFAMYCASCHGEGAQGGFGPTLTNLATRKDRRTVSEIIRHPLPSMPPLYPATINDKDVAEIEAYLLSIQADTGERG